MEKLPTLPVDAVLLDLEDAVAPDAKVAARDAALKAVAAGAGGAELVLRVNGLDTEWGADDVAAVAGAARAGRPVPAAVVVPKVGGTADVDAVCAAMGADVRLPLWAMMETPDGIINAPAIAAHERVECLVAGLEDLRTFLGASFSHVHRREPMMYALGAIVMAARAADITCLDGVWADFKNLEDLRDEAEQGLRLGFHGKVRPSRGPSCLLLL